MQYICQYFFILLFYICQPYTGFAKVVVSYFSFLAGAKDREVFLDQLYPTLLLMH